MWFGSSVAGKPVLAHRCIVEHGGSLVCGKGFRELLELIPKHCIGAREPVDREVALQHATRGTEAVDHIHVPIAIRSEQLIRTRRLFSLVPAIAIDDHLDAAKFCDDIWILCEFSDRRFPRREYFIAAAGIRSHSARTTEMV